VHAKENEHAPASIHERLQELENLREALSLGAVDGFVVGPNDDNKRVLLLSGAYVRYRRLVDDMEQGAVTVTRTGEILFQNRSFANLLGLTGTELFRHSLSQFVAPDDRERFQTFLKGSGVQRDLEVELRPADGVPRRVRLAINRDYDDFATIIVTDVTGRDDLQESNDTVSAIRKGEVDALVNDRGHVLLLDPRRPDVVRLRSELAQIAEQSRASLAVLRRSQRLDDEGLAMLQNLERLIAQLASLSDGLGVKSGDR
jgi:PAS domain S-box-containing protein